MGFSAICFIWKTSCTNRKVDRGWQIYFGTQKVTLDDVGVQWPHWPRQSSYFATLGARVDTRYFIVLHSTKTPVLYRTNTHMDKSIMGDSGPLAAQKSFSEYSVSSSPSVLISV